MLREIQGAPASSHFSAILSASLRRTGLRRVLLPPRATRKRSLSSRPVAVRNAAKKSAMS
jgi:hypothetical protein